jgi:hypothetical protein
VNNWWPAENIAADLGVPGYARSTKYNVFNLAFWTKSYGALDVAQLWANPLFYMTEENPFGSTADAI